jgi:hypothetical protein
MADTAADKSTGQVGTADPMKSLSTLEVKFQPLVLKIHIDKAHNVSIILLQIHPTVLLIYPVKFISTLRYQWAIFIRAIRIVSSISETHVLARLLFGHGQSILRGTNPL